MALAKRQSRNERLMLIGLAVVIIALVGYFAYSKFYLNSSNNSTTTTGGTTRTVITDFGESILNDSRYSGLQDYGVNVNVDVNQSGQPNLFQ